MTLGLGLQQCEALSGKDQRDLLPKCPGGQGQIHAGLQCSRRLRLSRQRDEPVLAIGIGCEIRQKTPTGLILPLPRLTPPTRLFERGLWDRWHAPRQPDCKATAPRE